MSPGLSSSVLFCSQALGNQIQFFTYLLVFLPRRCYLLPLCIHITWNNHSSLQFTSEEMSDIILITLPLWKMCYPLASFSIYFLNRFLGIFAAGCSLRFLDVCFCVCTFWKILSHSNISFAFFFLFVFPLDMSSNFWNYSTCPRHSISL